MTAPTTPGTSRLASLALALALLAGIAIPVDLALHGRARTGALGLPFDDAWIHLSYARTLAEHGSYAHSPGAPAASGSTSPLMVLLEAALFRLIQNEKLLAIGLSLAAWAAFLVTFAAWARRRLGGAAWAAAAVLLVGFDPRLAILAAAGGETSLFLLATALAFHQRLARRPYGVAIALGAALWARPEGLLLAALFALDGLLPRAEAAAKKRAATPAASWQRPLVVFGGLAIAYGIFHWSTGRALIPDALLANAALLRGASRVAYLRESVLPAFLTAGWMPILPLLLVAIGVEFARLLRGRPQAARLEVLWVLALPVVCLLWVPERSRFQRDLMPALPAAVIAALAALQALLAHPRLAGFTRAVRQPAARVWAPALAAGAALALAVAVIPRTAKRYEDAVRHVQERQERTGRWLAEHTPPEAVIATHDVGAIGFYSRRRILDTMGRLTPEVLPGLGTTTYPALLERLFAERGVSHIAAIETWLPVDNVAPRFESQTATEVMRVFPWRPGRSHVVHGRAWGEAAFSSAALQRGDNELAIASLSRAVRVDSRSAQLWYLLGVALGNADRADQAEIAFRRAVLLYPEWPDPRDGLLSALIAQDKPFRMSDIERLGYPDSAAAHAPDAARPVRAPDSVNR